VKHSGFAVFVLFFGVALIEAVQQHNWAEASLFAGLGVLFLWSGARESAKKR
jgi:hypothetical protein